MYEVVERPFGSFMKLDQINERKAMEDVRV
jgi:hypothetical protein